MQVYNNNNKIYYMHLCCTRLIISSLNGKISADKPELIIKAEYFFTYLSALVFFLLTICKMRPAVNNLAEEKRLTLISRDKSAAS